VVGAGPVRYQWHVFLAVLDPTRGAEQAGRRPVLVISREQINQLLPVVNVIPLTSRKSAARVIYPNEFCCLLVWLVYEWTLSPCVIRFAPWTKADWNKIGANWMT